MNDSLYMFMISCLPRKRVGRLVGAIAGWEGSTWLSRTVVRWFARRFSVDVGEALEPLERYPNLQRFFIRSLAPGARPIDDSPDAVLSPVDGVIAECGQIDDNICVQVKGRTYTVDELLGGEHDASPFYNGYFLTIYLSPRDYHRIHAPVDGNIIRYHHIPGHLFPVNRPSVQNVDRLFAVNERVISILQLNRRGSPEVALVKVGAIGVGRIRVSYHDRLTNRPGQFEREEMIHPGYHVDKGQELGAFELGSTVILLFPPRLIEPPHRQAGQAVRMGESIATFVKMK